MIAFLDLENILTLAFPGFSFILHLVHQFVSLSRSFCKFFAVKSMLLLTTHVHILSY